MGKFLLIAGILLLLVLGIFIFVLSRQGEKMMNNIPKSNSQKEIEFKAGFAIFTNGTYRVFDDPKYHNQSKEVFMEEANIVIVKKPGVTWSDLFTTLPMSLKKDCLVTGTGQTFCTNETERLRFFVNNKEDSNALDREIQEGDKLLVTYGSETEEQINAQIQQVPSLTKD